MPNAQTSQTKQVHELEMHGDKFKIGQSDLQLGKEDFQVKQSIAQVVKRRRLKTDQSRITQGAAAEERLVVVFDEEKKAVD